MARLRHALILSCVFFCFFPSPVVMVVRGDASFLQLRKTLEGLNVASNRDWGTMLYTGYGANTGSDVSCTLTRLRLALQIISPFLI